MATNSLKGRKQSPEHIAKRQAARKANGTDKGYKITKAGSSERYSASSKKKWEEGLYKDKTLLQTGSKHTPETIEKMRETRRQMWADGRYENKKPATRRSTSAQELALIPYLKKLGYRHNTGEEIESFISCGDRTRLPDFIDIEGRRIFEYFGNFWHHPTDERVWIEEYGKKNWTCTVLWESDLQEWLEEHKHLVTAKQHEKALATSRARNRYVGKGNPEIVR